MISAEPTVFNPKTKNENPNHLFPHHLWAHLCDRLRLLAHTSRRASQPEGKTLMNAKLYRKGESWIIQALACHSFKSAKEARQWAKKNRLRLIRSDHLDQ